MSDKSEQKKSKLVLPKESRDMMVKFLEAQHIMDIDNQDDEEVLRLYNEHVLKMQQKVNNYEVSAETKSLNQYMRQNNEIKITDNDFIARLFKMNVPYIYLHLFKDAHAELTDRELWNIVNKSGIDPIKDPADLTRMKRTPIKPKVA